MRAVLDPKMLTEQAIQEFQAIYFKTYGKELSFAEASEQAHSMIRLIKLVFKGPLNDQAMAPRNTLSGQGENS